MKNTSHSRAVRSARSACAPAPTCPESHSQAGQPRMAMRGQSGFTLLELLTALTITSMLVVMLFAAFNQASKAWTTAENRVETFTQARAALDFMTKELSQAIVTTNITFLADTNNLAFIAPVNDGTNAVDIIEVVYRLSRKSDFSTAGTDPTGVFVDAPDVWPKKLVRRTSHFAAPASEGWDYGQGKAYSVPPWDFYVDQSGGVFPNPDWPETSVPSRTAVIAENVVSLDFRFVDASGSPMQWYWNSNAALPANSWSHELQLPAIPPGSTGSPVMTNRAPAGVQITIGIVDSKTATRLSTLAVGSDAWKAITNQAARVFSTAVAIPNRQP